jgi:hypothetical protein
MRDTLGAIVTSEFFWGIVVGLLLSLVGSYALVRFQGAELRKRQTELIKRFAADTVKNISAAVRDMEELRGRTDLIHHDFLVLLDNEIAVFNRNREHTIHLSDTTREAVREFVNKCSIRRAEIGNFLQDYYSVMRLADQVQSQGGGPEAGRLRQSAGVPKDKANKALDQLVQVVSGGAALVDRLGKDRGAS